MRRVGSHGGGIDRARRLAAFPGAGLKQMFAFLTTHSTLAGQFAGRIGLDEAACAAIRQATSNWTGKVIPTICGPRRFCLPARLADLLASPVEVLQPAPRRRSGQESRRKHRGTQFDPAVADLFCERAPELLDGLDDAAGWDAVLDAGPRLARRVAGADLDDVLEAIADLVDLKSPYLAGHSRGVANLASAAARASGLSADDATGLRRAGLRHDLGRLGVSTAIWDKRVAWNHVRAAAALAAAGLLTVALRVS